MYDLMHKKISEYLLTMSTLNENEVRHFTNRIEINSYKKGEYFCKAGALSNKVGFVLSGLFRIYYPKKNKNIFIRAFCGEGAPIASYATLLKLEQNAHVNIEALEPSSVAEMPFTVFTSFYEQHSGWERVGRKIAEKVYLQREKREFQLLALDATERYKLFLEEHSNYINRISKGDMANYLGINPASLSRIIREVNRIE